MYNSANLIKRHLVVTDDIKTPPMFDKDHYYFFVDAKVLEKEWIVRVVDADSNKTNSYRHMMIINMFCTSSM